MTFRDVVTWGLVIAAGALEVLACVGVALMRDALDRVHYGGPTALAGVCAGGAVLAHGGWSLIGMRAILLALILVVTTPVLSHATARALHRQREGR
jgi:multicomponent Na+:H+ antiporter subunit G